VISLERKAPVGFHKTVMERLPNHAMTTAAPNYLLPMFRIGLGVALLFCETMLAAGAAYWFSQASSVRDHIITGLLFAFFIFQAYLVWRILLFRRGRSLTFTSTSGGGPSRPSSPPPSGDGPQPPLAPVPRPPGGRPPTLSAAAPLDDD